MMLMQTVFAVSKFLSVPLSLKHVHCGKTKETTFSILLICKR